MLKTMWRGASTDFKSYLRDEHPKKPKVRGRHLYVTLCQDTPKQGANRKTILLRNMADCFWLLSNFSLECIYCQFVVVYFLFHGKRGVRGQAHLAFSTKLAKNLDLNFKSQISTAEEIQTLYVFSPRQMQMFAFLYLMVIKSNLWFNLGCILSALVLLHNYICKQICPNLYAYMLRLLESLVFLVIPDRVYILWKKNPLKTCKV